MNKMDGWWSGNQVIAQNKASEEFYLSVSDRMRGQVPVTVIQEGDDWQVIHNDKPVSVLLVTKLIWRKV